MINTSRWDVERITPGLGREWWFPSEQSYKPYPHCRILHAPLDALTEILETNAIRTDEIDEIKAWVEGFVMQPLWLNRQVEHQTQAQFSMAHGLSVGAHRIPPGKQWQSHEVVFDPSVVALMDKVKFEVHPDYEKQLSANSASRPTRIEVRARGRTFVGERRYPKGSPSPEASTRMTNDELAAKFTRNAEGVLEPRATDAAINQVWQLESARDLVELLRLVSGRSSA
jgi:2-methylcitrate dehydratase PrpD